MSKDPKTDTPPASGPTAAEKQARKELQAIDGAAAWSEYQDQESARRARTAELRAERLAREAKAPAKQPKKKG